jgi:hypothetical protein
MILFAMPCVGHAVQSRSVCSTAPATRSPIAKFAVPMPRQRIAVRAAPPVRLSVRSQKMTASIVKFSAKKSTVDGSVVRATVCIRVVSSPVNSRPARLLNLPQLIVFRSFNSDKCSPTTRRDHEGDRRRDWPVLSSVLGLVPAGPGCKCADRQSPAPLCRAGLAFRSSR